MHYIYVNNIVPEPIIDIVTMLGSINYNGNTYNLGKIYIENA